MQIIPRWLYGMLLAMAIVAASCQSIEPVPSTQLSVSATPVLIPTAINQQTSTISETVNLLPTVTPTSIPTATVGSMAANVLPAPLYFLGEDQQIWLLEQDGGLTQLTSETFPISGYDVSPVHGRLTFVTNNQLIEFDPITKKRAIKVEGGPLPVKDSDGLYNLEDAATIILGTPSYSPDGFQIAYTLAGVNLLDSGLETAALPRRLVGNTLFGMAEHVTLTGKVELTENVEQIRLYRSTASWSPDGKKLLLGYSGWEWFGYDLYDLTTNSIRSVPIGMSGEWTWAKDGESAIIAHGGHGGPFHTGLYILDLDTMTSEQFDLDSLGVSNEANPFTPLARVAYEYSDSRIAFFMGTRLLRQDDQSLVYYSLAEIDPVTNSVFWSDVTEFRQEIELGEVLWAEDGSGFINHLPSDSVSWHPRLGIDIINLNFVGTQFRWGTPFAQNILNPISTFPATATTDSVDFSATPVPNSEQKIGDYTLRIWNGSNYPNHLPGRGYYGTATLTHVDGRELIIPDADLAQPIPVSDINGDGYPDVALRLNVGGSHCCIGTVVYTLDDGPTKLLETFDPGRPMYAGDFQDLDQDSIYEFIAGDDIGGCNGSRIALTVLRYDAAQGYIGSAYRFPQAYEDTLSRLLAHADNSSDFCDLSTIAFNYLYMGLPIEAWASFARFNKRNQNIFTEHEWTERRALSGKFFAAKPPGIQIIEDFASEQGENVIQPYQINDADGASQVVISVLEMDEYAKDKKFLALDYRINGQMGQRYVGLERCFDQTQDWLQTPILDTAIRNPTDHPVTFFLQFGEGKRCGNEPFSGEVWRTAVTLQPHESQVLTVSLDSSDHFVRTKWSPQQNEQIDLQQIGYFAFGVETDEPQAGILHISPIRLWP